MRAPSTAWREQIAPDEEARYAEYASTIAALQKAKSAKLGKGRALHRRAPAGLRGRFEVLADLPEHARHGLFAKPGAYDAWLRLSNGSMSHQKDRVGDVRGYAIKIHGVVGKSALGDWDTDSQDFLLINRDTFSSAKSDEFMGIITAVAQSPLALVGFLVKRYGLFAGLKRAKALADGLNRPFSGFFTEAFHTAAPIAIGPYAAKVRLQPTRASARSGASDDWAADAVAQLASGGLAHDLQLQFYVDESVTPIEDASVSWPESESPFVTVGRLTVPQQTLDPTLVAQIEAGKFDPWNALAVHRPLGDVMRARKGAYYASQQGRA